MTKKGDGLCVTVQASLVLSEDFWGAGEMVLGLLDNCADCQEIFQAVRELVMEDPSAYMQTAKIDVAVSVPVESTDVRDI